MLPNTCYTHLPRRHQWRRLLITVTGDRREERLVRRHTPLLRYRRDVYEECWPMVIVDDVMMLLCVIMSVREWLFTASII